MINYKEMVGILNENLKGLEFSLHVYPWWSDAHCIDVPKKYKDKYELSNYYLEVRDDEIGEPIAWLNRYKPINGGTVMYNWDEVWVKTNPTKMKLDRRLKRKYRGA